MVLPPDLVADAADWSDDERWVNRYDTLNREKLPDAMYTMELEWRVHPVEGALRLLATRSIGVWLLIAFVANAFVAGPLLRAFGSGIFSPQTYPVFFVISGLTAYLRFTWTSSFSEAAWWFLLPQAAAIFLELSYSPAVDKFLVVLPVVFSAVFIGYLADQVNTHFVRWMTASLWLKREAAERRRRLWTLRFRPWLLTREIDALEASILTMEADGREGEAIFSRRRLSELREIREYPIGFLVIAYAVVLILAGASGVVLTASTVVLSWLLASRRPGPTARLSQLIGEVIVHSFVSWLSWDPHQKWTNSPGYFRDGLTSRWPRLTQTVAWFFLSGIAFIPPVQHWSAGATLSPKWLWIAGCQFFFVLAQPVLLLLCALVATGARPLWLHWEAIELRAHD